MDDKSMSNFLSRSGHAEKIRLFDSDCAYKVCHPREARFVDPFSINMVLTRQKKLSLSDIELRSCLTASTEVA